MLSHNDLRKEMYMVSKIKTGNNNNLNVTFSVG